MCVTKIIQSCQIDILYAQFLSMYQNISKRIKHNFTKCHFHLLEALLSLVLSVQEKVPLLVDEPIFINEKGKVH